MASLKKSFKVIMVTSLIVVVGLIVETKDIGIKRIDLKAPNSDLEGLKVLHFTDLHLGDYYSLNELKALVNKINKLKPDLVFFTGDLIDSKSKTVIDSGVAINLLKSIKSSYGKFAVLGNHDTRKNLDKIESILDGGMFTLLRNINKTIKVKDSNITICGVDDFISGYRDIYKTFDGLGKESFKLVLCHEGDLIGKLTEGKTNSNIYGIDYMFSGHTHGGQIKLPFMKCSWLPYLGKKYVKGVYSIDERASLCISTGVGATGIPLRMGNKPEIVLYEFKNLD